MPRYIDVDLLRGKITAMQACEPKYAYNFLNDAQNPSTEWGCIEDMIESIPVIIEPVCLNCGARMDGGVEDEAN